MYHLVWPIKRTNEYELLDVKVGRPRKLTETSEVSTVNWYWLDRKSREWTLSVGSDIGLVKISGRFYNEVSLDSMTDGQIIKLINKNVIENVVKI